jgi:hypothetical protein
MIYIRVLDTPRRDRFFQLLGNDTLPVTTRRPRRLALKGLGKKKAYLVDLAALTPEQRARIEQDLATTFQSPLKDVRQQLDAIGLPVTAQYTRRVKRL